MTKSFKKLRRISGFQSSFLIQRVSASRELLFGIPLLTYMDLFAITCNCDGRII